MSIKTTVSKFFAMIVIITMFWAIGTTIFLPKMNSIFSLFRATQSLSVIKTINVVCLLFVLFLLFFYVRKISKIKVELSNKKVYVILILELVVYCLMLLFFYKWIGFINPVDDTRITLNILEYLGEKGHLNYDYMYSNPQNLMLMYFFKSLQSIFGKNYQVLIFAFCIIHSLSILFIFWSLKNLKINNFISLLTIQVLFFSAQLSLHVGVAYTDILAIFFVSVALFFLTKFFRLNVNLDSNSRSFCYLFLSLILVSIGYLSKGTVLIVALALSVGFFFIFTGFKKLICFLPLLFLLVGNFGWNHFIQSQHIFPDNNYGQPNTHYLMMGLSGTGDIKSLSSENIYTWIPGAYSGADQELTWKLFLDRKISKKQISQQHFEIIKKRLKNLNGWNMLCFLNNKVAVTWSTGDLKSTYELKLGVDESSNRLNLLSNNYSGAILYMLMTIVQYLIYIGIILAAILCFKNYNSFIFISNIFISGYFFFLLLWEASPRYSMLIFPFGILMIGYFLKSSSEGVKNKKIK